MAANTWPIFTLMPRIPAQTFANADGTTEKALFVAGADGSRVEGIEISSTDTANQSVAFWINNGITDYYIGVVAVPLGSGYTTVARVEGINVLAPASEGALILPATYTLKCAMVAAVTSPDLVTVVAFGGDF